MTLSPTHYSGVKCFCPMCQDVRYVRVVREHWEFCPACNPSQIERAAKRLYRHWFPDAPVDEHFVWYHDGEINKESCVHFSNVAKALSDARAVLVEDDEAFT